MKRLFLLGVLLTLGCATTGNQSEGPTLPTLAEITLVAAKAQKPPLAIPLELRGEIEQAERMGTMIYQQDQASISGNEALLANTTPDERSALGGSISQPEANDDGTAKGSWSVQFFTDGPTPQIQFRVRVFMDSQKPTFEKVTPPLAASAHLIRLIEAQKTALTAISKTTRTSKQPLRPILFPVEMNQQKLWIVYLLAGTSQPDTVVLGQHFRLMVSGDGKAVTRQTPMSGDMVELPANPGGTGTLAVVHKETAWPNETHVFASLLQKQPIYVGTMKYIWSVDGARISLLEKKPDEVEETKSSDNSAMDTFNSMESMSQPDPM